MECIFCKIARAELPVTLTYADDHVVVFADAAPRAPVHQLLIPRQHLPTLNEAATAEHTLLLGHILTTAARVAAQLGIAETGYRVVNNCHAEGGQTVFHLHFHLLGGRAMTWPPG